MARGYATASSVFHSLPSSPGAYRERKVTFEDEQCTADSFGDESAVSQEESDLRLAIALQKQENVAAYERRKKRRDDAFKAGTRRTGRSCAHGFGLSVRDASPEATLSVSVVPAKVSATPDSSLDMDEDDGTDDSKAPAWVKIQKVEKSAAGPAAAAQRILEEAIKDKGAQRRRAGMSASKPMFDGRFAVGA